MKCFLKVLYMNAEFTVVHRCFMQSEKCIHGVWTSLAVGRSELTLFLINLCVVLSHKVPRQVVITDQNESVTI